MGEQCQAVLLAPRAGACRPHTGRQEPKRRVKWGRSGVTPERKLELPRPEPIPWRVLLPLTVVLGVSCRNQGPF